MGFRENLTQLGLETLGATGYAVSQWAGRVLSKAEGGFSAKAGMATGEGDTPPSDIEGKPVKPPVPTEKATTEPKTLFYDPFAIIEQLGFKDKPSAVTFNTLKAMTWKLPIVAAILQTRINQVASFARPQHDRYQMGFRLRLREVERLPTKQERIWSRKMESVIMRSGVTDNFIGRETFEEFLRKLTWDSLVYDQMTFEVVDNRKHEPAEWYAVDSSTIRLADSASLYQNEDKLNAVRYVQIYDGMIIAEYSQNEMCFAVRNPRTDIRQHGYGISELEMLVPTITSLLYAHEYNTRFFSQGSAAKGIINFKGAVPEKTLQQFRRHWYQMLSGVENAWRTPITNAEELQYINLQNSSRDMEFNAWMDFLIKTTCSVYSMDPIEVNFKYGNEGQRSGLNEASNKEKITASQERGLRPLLRFISNALNQHIIWRINEDFEFDFVGLDANTRDEAADLNSKRVKTFMMIDELRAEDDLPPLPKGQGQVILDSTWLQATQMQQAQEQQAAQGEGAPPQEGEGEAPTEGEPEEVDFKKLLSQYEDENEGEGEGETETEKSLVREWTVNF